MRYKKKIAYLVLFLILSAISYYFPQKYQEKASSTTVAGMATQTKSEIQNLQVIKVVDGDTLRVQVEGKDQAVRVIGINTPETVDPRRAVECFGKEASDKAKELLSGTVVRLESDPTQDTVDKYGRLLRYVYLQDGTDYGMKMIEEGFAYEYTYETPYKYQTQYKKAQANASRLQKGLWNPAACPQN